MKWLLFLAAALLLALSLSNQTHAQTSTNTITVEQAWARATPRGALTGAAYMTLINNGASADRLLSATTAVADQIQFHKQTEDNGVSRMREVHNVELSPGGKIIFKPGDMHMMIVGIKQPLQEGQTFPLTLQFEKAGKIDVTVPIEKVGAMRHEDMGSNMQMPNDKTGK
jgi:copper(I)-binding protein